MPPNHAARSAVLRELVGPPPDAGSDADLLAQFCTHRDESAFAALVRRHGGLVLDVCRSVLRNEADAEDAFQATFLALAGGAGRVRRPAALAGWLHAVAWRTARKVRRARARRQTREAAVPARLDVPAPDPSWAEVRQAIHEEVNRLPDRYRSAIVLFYLAGRTQDEVRCALGLSTAGAKKRLERGRALLRSALDRRGLGPTAGLAAAAVALPAPPAALAGSAAELAVRYVMNPGAVPPAVLSLMDSGVRSMTAKIVFGATVLAGVAATAGLGAFRGDTPDLPHRADTRVAARTQPAADPEKPQPARGDGSAKKSPPAAGPTVNLERFRALTPGERMKLVERLSGDADPFTAAKRADLAASVTERGSVEPSNPAELVCKVKARDKDGPATTIKWLIDDGSMVKKGDRLAQLDDSRLREEFEAAKVKQQVAEAARVRAAENVRLAQQEGAVEVRLAEIDVKLAEVELKNAPSPKEKEVLELKAEQAKLRLERATVRSKGQVRLAEAELHARSAALEREVQRQRDIELEVRECVLLAPIGGIAVYHVPAPARFGAAVPVIAPGEPVREGQKLLRVVDLKQLAIGTRIHEAQVSTVRVGQAVQVRVDALPDKLFHGKVTQVSPVASAPDWQKSDVKVYPATIALDDPPPGLKPGMSVEVRIATADRKDVLQVPLKAVVGTGKGRTCFVKLGQEVVERSVVTGASDGRSVEIKEGLKEGDLVINDPPALLARP